MVDPTDSRASTHTRPACADIQIIRRKPEPDGCGYWLYAGAFWEMPRLLDTRTFTVEFDVRSEYADGQCSDGLGIHWGEAPPNPTEYKDLGSNYGGFKLVMNWYTGTATTSIYHDNTPLKTIPFGVVGSRKAGWQSAGSWCSQPGRNVWRRVRLEVTDDSVRLTVDGQLYFDASGLADYPFAGPWFGISGKSGGWTMNLWVRDVQVVTGGLLETPTNARIPVT